MVIQIGLQPTGEEHDQHVIRVASRVSRMTTVREVHTKLNLGPCTRDEVLAPSDHPTRLSSWDASFSLQQTTSRQGGTIQQSS
jgi:hypothetical protein